MRQNNFWDTYYRAEDYTVQPGDTLYSIATKFKTTVSDIKLANNLTSDVIYPGQFLNIPILPAIPYGIYKIGNRGPNVIKIQQALSSLGFNIAQDGIYGPVTANTIMNLQKKYPEALAADAIYGPKTRTYLERLLTSNYKIVQNPESNMVLVNKLNGLLPSYVPKNLTVPNVPFYYPEYRPQKLMRPEAAGAIEALFAKAKQDNIALNAVSGYRSYDYQSQLFARNIQANPNANQFSSRPGESEHQTGLAMDVSSPSVGNNLTQSFGDTGEGRWLAENAPEYGFILRYPKGKEGITGYQYEPWHIRYVGRDAARQITSQNKTLEEYLGQTAA